MHQLPPAPCSSKQRQHRLAPTTRLACSGLCCISAAKRSSSQRERCLTSCLVATVICCLADRMEGELEQVVSMLVAEVQAMARRLLDRLAHTFSVLWCVACRRRVGGAS